MPRVAVVTGAASGRKVIACVLAWQLGLSGGLATAGVSSQSSAGSYWVEATLVAVDAARQRVSYRAPAGDVVSVAVQPGPLEKLTTVPLGQRVRLKCARSGDDTLVVEAKRVGGGHNWWKWGVLTFLGLFLVGMLWALSEPGSDALL